MSTVLFVVVTFVAALSSSTKVRCMHAAYWLAVAVAMGGFALLFTMDVLRL